MLSALRMEKDELLTCNEDISNRWIEFFSKLLNKTQASETNLRENIGQRDTLKFFIMELK